MRMQGVEMSVSGTMKLYSIASAAMMALLGIYMIAGAIGTLRGLRAGVTRLRRWAVARLLYTVIGTSLSIVLLPAQLDMQESMQNAVNEMLVEREAEEHIREFDRAGARRTAIWMAAGFSIAFSVYPSLPPPMNVICWLRPASTNTWYTRAIALRNG